MMRYNKEGVTMFQKIIKTKVGNLLICSNNKGITKVTFCDDQEIDTRENKWILQCEKELYEYIDKKRKNFSVPLDMKGTAFQIKVWNALCQIPYGETKSYKDIAREINNPKAYRAVGMANHKNPICILIPCHRVIGTNGKLVGYASGLENKRKLLNLEKE